MSHVTRNTSAWAVCAAILALCSTGCMLSPQHGQDIGRISDNVLFAGATMSPGQNIVIQGKLPNTEDGWEFIKDVHTSGTGYGYTDSNGDTWYRWPAILHEGYFPIPTRYWKSTKGGPKGTTHEAEVRAIIAGEDQGLPTVEDGFRYSPFGSQGSIHGDSVTVYAKVSKGR